MTRFLIPTLTAITAILAGLIFVGCGDSSSGSSNNPVGPNFQITTTTLPGSTIGSVYSQSVMVANGSEPYRWAVSSGSLPTGLSLDTYSGSINGTITATGTFDFTIQVIDRSNTVLNQSYSITVGNAPVTWDALVLPDGQVGVAYSFDLKTLVSDGASPYTFSITTGALPDGLTLDSSGVLSGTPTTSGTTSVGFRVDSADGSAATNGTDISINP